MPRYRIMSRQEWHTGWGFDADSLDHAKEIVEQLENGDLALEDLPNVYEKTYGTDTELYDLEEVGQ